MRPSVKKKVLACTALVLLVTMTPFTSQASLTDMQQQLQQAEQEKKETENKLNDTKNNIDNLTDTQNTLKGKLNTLNDELTDVSENLSSLEDQIKAKNQEIDETQAALDEAKQTEENQYEAMKARIKFMYERSDYAYMEVFFSAKSFSGFLNNAEYIEKLEAYDRKMLVQYQETRTLIEEEEAKLQQEKADLDDLKVQAEAEKGRVAGLVSQTSGTISQYSNQISGAQAEAEQYEAEIKKKESDIAELRKKIAEEMAKSKLAAESSWRDISEVSFVDGDRYLLANLIYCEAGGEPYAGKLAVGAVVINRVLSSVYPDSMVGVIYQRSQFSPVASGRLALALAENRATAACYQAADEAMTGQTNVGNCVYFRTPIEGLTGISIGGHIFY
ncbi:MAG: cell wall hydrolase [Lachnospiraceae bacterium]|nr:cell wall hydrolase [Lachnospiraceae bacterium]